MVNIAIYYVEKISLSVPQEREKLNFSQAGGEANK